FGKWASCCIKRAPRGKACQSGAEWRVSVSRISLPAKLITRDIQTVVLLLIAVAAVGVVAKRSNIPPAILLVLTGVLLALVPGLPSVGLAPEVVLLLVLPPLIYSSAVAM